MGDTFVNYYDILGLSIESTEKEILKAYKKKALQCHPDKNPDNPKAVDLFLGISEALKVLTDPQAKSAFDKVLKAKEAAKLRTKAYDDKRKKFKDDLERRETAAQEDQQKDDMNAERLAAEIKRLREQGSKLLKEQQELIERQLREERMKQTEEESVTPKIKVKWKCSRQDHQNGGYNDEVLKRIFSKYGAVEAVLLSRKKNGMAIIEFKIPANAALAMAFERGLEDCPFSSLSWLEGGTENKSSSTSVPSNGEKDSQPQDNSLPTLCASEQDFENLVLMRMRQAEERKRLTQQIVEQDRIDQEKEINKGKEENGT